MTLFTIFRYLSIAFSLQNFTMNYLAQKLKWLSITKVVYWKVFRIIFEKKLKTYQKLKWGLVWMLFI